MSCNGCRVLRKGCTEDCTIRPCLQWIKSPDSQANATLFLAKFYGRAGLINLIEASPHHLRPATFRSLLYEACGRIVCPVNGCTGLIWSGNWAQCHAAVDAVLAGSTIITSPTPPSPTDARAAQGDVGTFKSCDIRHVSKDKPSAGSNYSAELNRIRNRIRFKQSAPSSTSDHLGSYNVLMGPGDRWNQLPGHMGGWFESTNSNSSGSWLGQRLLRIKGDNSGNNSYSSSKEDSESFFSVQTVEDSLMKMDRVLDDVNQGGRTQGSEIELDLTLGPSPIGF